MKKKLFFVALLLMITLLVGCGKKEDKSSIVGSWDYSGFVFTFNEDKTGSYTVADTEMTFTYEDKGDSIDILYDGKGTSTVSYKYKVEDNNLYLTDNTGKETKYIKK